jgi:hypothetical protein
MLGEEDGARGGKEGRSSSATSSQDPVTAGAAQANSATGAFRRKREERFSREMANKDNTALLMVCLSLVWCQEVRVWFVPFTLERGMSLCLKVSHHREMVIGVLCSGVVSLLDVPSLVANTSTWGTIVVLGPRGATGHGLPFVVRVVLQRDMWVFHQGEI